MDKVETDMKRLVYFLSGEIFLRGGDHSGEGEKQRRLPQQP